MQTVFICHAREDHQLAKDLTEFLEQGSSVQVFLEEGERGSGETIVSKAADALQAEVILLVLSPHSIPARWVRAEWERALFDEPKKAGVKVGTILAGQCEFPLLLRRAAFFDATQDRLAAFRGIKRWLLSLAPHSPEVDFEPARQAHFENREAELESLRQALADAPGVAVVEGPSGSGKTTLALEFTRQSKPEFEGLVWLNCLRQSLAALVGEMASQLGIVMEGDEEESVRELAAFCTKRRILVVLDDAPDFAGRLIAGGRSSTLLTMERADLFGGPMISIDPVDEFAANRAIAGLSPEQRKLWAAACACGDAPFRLRLLSEMGFDPKTAADLIALGLVIQLDERYSLSLGHSKARQSATPTDALSRAHAHAVNRLFAEWTREDSECEADLPQLRRALDWALSQDDQEAWVLACQLAKRGVALLKSKRRHAEEFELLENVSRKAAYRKDWPMLEYCLWDQIWILEPWGRIEEAQTMRAKIRRPGQMPLDFGQAGSGSD